MATGIKIQLQGLEKLQKKLGKLPETLVHEVDAEMGALANEYVNRVVAATPVDTGRLKGATEFEKVADMKYEITNNVHYAPYVEFGTVSFVSVPAELQAYAAQFKGQGLVKNGGIRARPFFFSHLPWARTQLNKNLSESVKRALNK